MTKIELLDLIEKYVPFGSPIYDAFKEIPREEFVPEDLKKYAYENRPLPIGCGQTISQPTMICMMLKVMDLKPFHKVLEIGTGSGYNAALLSKLVKEVYTIERIPELSYKAKKVFEKLGLNNIKCKIGDGTLGWSEYAPYDRIIVTAGAPSIPQSLKSQLKIGGNLVIPVGSFYVQELLKVIKVGENDFKIEKYGGCVFVKLIGKEGWTE